MLPGGQAAHIVHVVPFLAQGALIVLVVQQVQAVRVRQHAAVLAARDLDAVPVATLVAYFQPVNLVADFTVGNGTASVGGQTCIVFGHDSIHAVLAVALVVELTALIDLDSAAAAVFVEEVSFLADKAAILVLVGIAVVDFSCGNGAALTLWVTVDAELAVLLIKPEAELRLSFNLETEEENS